MAPDLLKPKVRLQQAIREQIIVII